MDAFQILSRSTSLRRPGKVKDVRQAQIPSAGSKVVSGPDLPPENETLNSKKRKRAARVSNDVVADACEESRDGASVDQQDDTDGEANAAEKKKMSTEDLHRLLNQNKLKVTWLNPPPAESKKTKSQGTVGAQSKKSNLIRLYPQPLTGLHELRSRYHISRRLKENLDAQAFTLPTEVQAGSLPILLGGVAASGLLDATPLNSSGEGDIDLLTAAPTGSGKTLAFLIPMIQSMLKLRHDSNDVEVEDCVRGVILAPTHELVHQIVIEGKKLTTGTGIRIAEMQKGAHVCQENGKSISTSPQGTTIVKADILVSTPLMLLHAIEGQSASKSLPSVRHLVLDEADVLLDPLFREQTLAIWTGCENASLRVSMWSATIGSSIEHLAQEFMVERRRKLSLTVKNQYLLRIIVGLKDSSLPSINHRLVYSGTEQGKLLGLRGLLHPSTSATRDQLPPLRPPFLIFTQTIERARALHSELHYDIPVEAGGSQRIAVLHSELTDHARSDVMTRFRRGELWVIITTDLLSRGIDFRGVNGVVNYDIPTTAASYVHRAGRTGRAGRNGGIAVTLYTREDIPYVKNIANVISATEKAHGKAADQAGQGLQQWLLDALPKVGRDAKAELKKKGIAARRTFEPGAKRPKEARRTRISTKSGYDRELAHRRKGAIEKSKRLAKATSDMDEGEEWAGFED